MATIAWIGLGHMGIPMSSNMLKAGYTVRGFDIDLCRAICNKALLLANGRRVFFGDIEEGFSRYAELR